MNVNGVDTGDAADRIIAVAGHAVDFVFSHQALLYGLGIFSAVAFVGTLAAVPVILVRLPGDYFAAGGPAGQKNTGTSKGPCYRGRDRGRVRLIEKTILRILRNIAGIMLLVAGTAMLFLPGQGLLTILIALTLIDFPGKRKMEISLLRRPGLKRAVDDLRRRYGREAMRLPEKESEKEDAHVRNNNAESADKTLARDNRRGGSQPG